METLLVFMKMISKGMACAAIALLLLPAAIGQERVGENANCLMRDGGNRLSHFEDNAEAPEWSVGDKWDYQLSFSVKTENMSFNFSIGPVVFNVTEVTEEGYDIDIGTARESKDIIEGSMFIDRPFKIKSFSLYAKGKILLFFDYEIEMSLALEPPVEIVKFPLSVSDGWPIFTNATLNFSVYVKNFIDESFSGIAPWGGFLNCTEKGNVSLPIGTFEAYHIYTLTNMSYWYSSAVGNIILMNILNLPIEEENVSISAQIELTSYSTSDLSIDIEKPAYGLYILNRKIISLPITIVIGDIEVEAKVQSAMPINKVVFFVDGEKKHTDEDESDGFKWTWYTKSAGNFLSNQHQLGAVAYDDEGNTTAIARPVWTFKIR